jgi:hypothetical protein
MRDMMICVRESVLPTYRSLNLFVEKTQDTQIWDERDMLKLKKMAMANIMCPHLTRVVACFVI